MISFNDFRAYRQVMKPLLEQKKLLRGNPPELDREPVDQDKLFSAGMLGMCLLIAVLMFVASCIHSSPAHAYTQEDAIKAVIGEAENQGEYGMLAVSCAIRNRGSLQGVYGLHAPRVVHHKYSKKIYRQAKMAWRNAMETFDIEGVDSCGMINGAQYWGSLTEDKKWIVKMKNLGYVHTATIGMQTFYRKDM